MIDSHCHLAQLKYSEGENLDCLLQCARVEGVNGFLSVATSIDNALSNLKQQNHHSDVWFSAGIHPLHPETTADWKARLTSLIEMPEFMAIGETGLDFFYASKAQEQKIQLDLFDYHCELSGEYQKPLIIHTRLAKIETLEMIKGRKLADVPGVIHCFTEDLEAAKKFLDLGFYLSFSGIISFKNAQSLRDVLKRVPLDRVLVETDSPYLVPEPHRGKPNQPKYVRQVAQAMADCYQVSLQQVCEITTKNFFNVFKTT